MNKIIIVGRPGSGKTTLSNRLEKVLDIPVYYLDRYVVDENAVRISQEDFIKKQQELMSGEKWIIDGNWAGTISYRIKNADTIIVFDFPVWLSLLQYVKRVVTNFNKVRPETGGGQKTKFRWHAIKSIVNYPRDQVLSAIENDREGKDVYILSNRNDVTEFMKKLG